MNNIETITLLKVDGICFETNDNVLIKAKNKSGVRGKIIYITEAWVKIEVAGMKDVYIDIENIEGICKANMLENEELMKLITDYGNIAFKIGMITALAKEETDIYTLMSEKMDDKFVEIANCVESAR